MKSIESFKFAQHSTCADVIFCHPLGARAHNIIHSGYIVNMLATSSHLRDRFAGDRAHSKKVSLVRFSHFHLFARDAFLVCRFWAQYTMGELYLLYSDGAIDGLHIPYVICL